jgi:putative component of toxin-antitoxin plasmid stabilization module
MYSLRQTQEFQDWLDGLNDRRAQVRIAARLRLAEAGNLGDWQPVGGEVSEMRASRFRARVSALFQSSREAAHRHARWRRQVITKT